MPYLQSAKLSLGILLIENERYLVCLNICNVLFPLCFALICAERVSKRTSILLSEVLQRTAGFYVCFSSLAAH